MADHPVDPRDDEPYGEPPVRKKCPTCPGNDIDGHKFSCSTSGIKHRGQISLPAKLTDDKIEVAGVYAVNAGPAVTVEIMPNKQAVFEERSLFFWAELEQCRKILNLRVQKHASKGGEEYVDLDMEEAREFEKWKKGTYR